MKRLNSSFLYALALSAALSVGLHIFAEVPAGSNTTVTTVALQQPLNSGDITGVYAKFDAGFNITGGTAQFNSIFEVNGNIDLSTFTLQLDRDLILSNAASITSMGKINAQNHNLELSATSTALPASGTDANCYTWDSVNLVLNANTTLNTCINFTGVSKISGNGYTLTLGDNGQINIGVDLLDLLRSLNNQQGSSDSDLDYYPSSSPSLLLENLTIKGLNGTNIHCIEDSSVLAVKNIEWIQDGDFFFDTGAFDVMLDWKLIGNGYKFAYQTVQTSSIEAHGRMILDRSFTFSYDPGGSQLNQLMQSRPLNTGQQINGAGPNSGLRSLLQFVENTSQLCLNGATLHATSTGLQLTKGQLVVDMKSSLAAEGNDESTGISFGDGASGYNNLNVYILPAATLSITQGMVVYDESLIYEDILQQAN